jgi:carboxymethylenebutenolidase
MPESAENLVAYDRWRVSYLSDGRELAGFWLLPDGSGPFPAAVFNHGSNGLLPASRPGILALRDMGYATFAAVRRGHNDQPGTFWLDQVTAPWGSPDMGDQLVSALRAELGDVRAAVNWVAGRPEVDSQRIVMLGSSFGGVLTVLALGEDSALRAGVSFAGPSMSWPDAPALQREMLAAAAGGQAPLFLAQAYNDNSLAPTYAIGAELARAGRRHETRIYPPIGEGPGGGHGMFGTGVQLWRPDVESFLARSLTELAVEGQAGQAGQAGRAG